MTETRRGSRRGRRATQPRSVIGRKKKDTTAAVESSMCNSPGGQKSCILVKKGTHLQAAAQTDHCPNQPKPIAFPPIGRSALWSPPSADSSHARAPSVADGSVGEGGSREAAAEGAVGEGGREAAGREAAGQDVGAVASKRMSRTSRLPASTAAASRWRASWPGRHQGGSGSERGQARPPPRRRRTGRRRSGRGDGDSPATSLGNATREGRSAAA